MAIIFLPTGTCTGHNLFLKNMILQHIDYAGSSSGLQKMQIIILPEGTNDYIKGVLCSPMIQIPMKRSVFTALLIFSATYLCAQIRIHDSGERPLNNAAVNICGDVAVLSLQYERLLFLNPHLFLAGKLGIGFDEPTLKYLFGYMTPPDNYLITIPHHLTGNLGRGRHFLELGIGGSLILERSGNQYLFYPVAGYRLQPLKTNRIHFRLYASLPFSGNKDLTDQFTPWGSSIGISF